MVTEGNWQSSSGAYENAAVIDDDGWTMGRTDVEGETEEGTKEIGKNLAKMNCRISDGIDKESRTTDAIAVVSGENYSLRSGESEGREEASSDEDVEGAGDEDDDCDAMDEDGEEKGVEGWVRRRMTRIDDEIEGPSVLNDIMPGLEDSSFGEVNITNSKHVHVGNTNFYKGPVTIKQFVYSNSQSGQPEKTDGSIAIAGSKGEGHPDVGPFDATPGDKDSKGQVPPVLRGFEKIMQRLWIWRSVIVLCVLALSVITVIAVLAVVAVSNNQLLPNESLPDSPNSGVVPGDDIEVDKVRFIERVDWSAQPPKETLTNLTVVPVPYVIISHTASMPCETQGECVHRVRVAQTLHMTSFKWSDIGYNFLVGGDHQAYVGRGWDAEGAHAFGWNFKSIGISFIGTFNDVRPSNKQLHAALKVIEVGIALNKIAKDYKLLGHRQVSATESPGDKLYSILTTWKHWSPTPAPVPMRSASFSPISLFLLLSCLSLIFLSMNPVLGYS